MSAVQKPIAHYIIPFLDYCEVEKGLSDNTQRNYRHYLNLFTHWLKKTGDPSLTPADLTADHVWEYRLYIARTYKTRAGNHLTRKSQNYYLIALRALLDYFADRDITALPSAKVKLAKQKDSETISFLSEQELTKLFALPDTKTPVGLRDRTILELLFSTGMRVSELVALDIEKVAFVADTHFPAGTTFELSIVGKGKHVRTIFISPEAARWLREYIRSRRDVLKPLFVNYRSRTDRKRLSPRAIQAMISRYARLAGITKKVTPHTLRHSYATDLLGHGADLRSVQELLGHKNVSTTQVYTHVTNTRLRSIHEKYHGKNGNKKDT